MKFVLIRYGNPHEPSTCTRCSCLLQEGFLCELSTRKQYCGLPCYLDNRISTEPPRAPLHLPDAAGPTIVWRKPAVDNMSELLAIT
jgi:hypothetical protein